MTDQYRYDPDGSAYSQGRLDGHAAGFAEAIEMAAKMASDLGDLSTVDAVVADFIAAAIRILAATHKDE